MLSLRVKTCKPFKGLYALARKILYTENIISCAKCLSKMVEITRF